MSEIGAFLHSYFSSDQSDEILDDKKLLELFDKVKRQRDRSDKKPGFPVHSEHGWYLPSDWWIDNDRTGEQ